MKKNLAQEFKDQFCVVTGPVAGPWQDFTKESVQDLVSNLLPLVISQHRQFAVNFSLVDNQNFIPDATWPTEGLDKTKGEMQVSVLFGVQNMDEPDHFKDCTSECAMLLGKLIAEAIKGRCSFCLKFRYKPNENQQ